MSQDSGFRNRAIKHSLNTRQLILGYRGSTKMHKTIGTPPCTLRQPWVSVSLETMSKLTGKLRYNVRTDMADKIYYVRIKRAF